MSDDQRDDPQAAGEQRDAARHLLMNPITTAERDPAMLRLIRRHEAAVDRWFTQRLGYRLHVDTDTARLYKSTYVPERRPLLATWSTTRPLRQLEYTMLALLCACTAAGPAVVSLRDLVDEVRSAAAEAGVDLAGDAAERRALVAALRWMIEQGLASELHEQVERYSTDETADAVLRMRPDRIALVPLPTLGDLDFEASAAGSSRGEIPVRQWLRARLVEDPVLYRDDCSDEEWGELRRRLGEESAWLDEMFGVTLESRAEGIAAIDGLGRLSDQRFPTSGTTGHAALLLIERLVAQRVDRSQPVWSQTEVIEIVSDLAERNATVWANDKIEAPPKLAAEVADLLVDLRLARRSDDHDCWLTLLPAAARFFVDPDLVTGVQERLL
ncbi:MAG TPA: TIGR02678 family protein [Microthrixaceae bacterium]|nr:TIGR02678 family protein [Microthrixaceae bacterium]